MAHQIIPSDRAQRGRLKTLKEFSKKFLMGACIVARNFAHRTPFNFQRTINKERASKTTLRPPAPHGTDREVVLRALPGKFCLGIGHSGRIEI
jgi:hypothetical protein